MEDVLLFILKQSPLVVFMSLVVWQQQKEKLALKKDLKEANKAHIKERKESNEDNNNRFAELAEQAHKSDIDNVKVLETIKVYLMKD